MDQNNIEQYRPLGAWAYVGYSLLYCIPLVGIICAIVFSFSNGNISRRNHARAYGIIMIIGGILGVISSACGLSIFNTASRITDSSVNSLDMLQQQMEESHNSIYDNYQLSY